MMSDLKPFPGLAEFLFESPLYEQVKRPRSIEERKSLSVDTVDGYCPECKRAATFRGRTAKLVSVQQWDQAPTNTALEVNIHCTRIDSHQIRFIALLLEHSVQKIGQYPSFATVSQAAIKEYRRFLEDQDAVELNRGIGLAAHGVGIGSFVYIRRIFERLIQRRFDENKAAEGWSEGKFKKMRMEDRIKLMKKHLPASLFEHRKIYGILSLGIHELDEHKCLSVFPVARRSIIHSLEEEHRRKAHEAERADLTKAIANYDAGT